MNLPNLDPTKIPIKASTQEHLDIEDIQEGIVILKDGSSCLVIETTAINFGLLSEKEQESTIYAYAGLINSLNFYIQILIRSQRKDVSSYLRLIDKAENEEPKEKVREQIRKYRDFVADLVSKNNVLDKKFYIIIPMSALEFGAAKTLSSAFKKSSLPYDKAYILEKAKINLFPKRDHLLRQLSRLGLKSRQLNTQELIKLFFNIYNPEVKGQRLSSSKEYSSPIVGSKQIIRNQETQNQPSRQEEETGGLEEMEKKIKESKEKIALQEKTKQIPEEEQAQASKENTIETGKPESLETTENKGEINVFNKKSEEEKPAESDSIQNQINDMINKSI